MQKLLFTGFALLFLQAVLAQQKEGRVVYERTIQLQMRFSGMSDGMEHMLPKSRTDKIEVLFGNNQSLQRQLEDELPEATNFGDGGGQVQIRVVGAGIDDITFYDFEKGRRVDQREFAAKKYLISDSIVKMNWKVTGQTREIAGYPCMQATTQRITTRMAMNMDNGKMKREEIPDTLNITAWFTTAIPVPAGPEYQGQLPGLIMAIDINNGNTVYKVIEISPVVDMAAIKEPKSGKKMTADEFAKEREKILEEMNRNNGGRRVIRMN